MNYNLTPIQKEVITWLVQQVKKGNLTEEFDIAWSPKGTAHFPKEKNSALNQVPTGLSKNNLYVLANEGLVMLSDGPLRAQVCTLTAKAYDAVDSDFGASDEIITIQTTEQIKIDLVKLSQLVQSYFSLDELDALCFEAGINFENIPGEPTLDSKSRNLVQYMARHGRLLPLLLTAVKNRPHTDWSSLYD